MACCFAVLVLVILSIVDIDCLDRERLAQTPRPQKGFDVKRFVGDWYFIYKLPPFSWQGSKSFSNYLSQYMLQDDVSIVLYSTYRSEVCTRLTDVLERGNKPGEYTMKDTIGDTMSGKTIIVATDYKSFAIRWGCTKPGTDGTCDDPYVTIKTRHLDPSDFTLRMIEHIIEHLFSLSLAEMVRFSQDDPCGVKKKTESSEIQQTGDYAFF